MNERLDVALEILGVLDADRLWTLENSRRTWNCDDRLFWKTDRLLPARRR